MFCSTWKLAGPNPSSPSPAAKAGKN